MLANLGQSSAEPAFTLHDASDAGLPDQYAGVGNNVDLSAERFDKQMMVPPTGSWIDFEFRAHYFAAENGGRRLLSLK